MSLTNGLRARGRLAGQAPTHRRLLLLSTASLVLLGAAGPGAAQTPPSTEPQEAVEIGEVVVTGIRASIADSITRKRNADGVMDVITAEDIGDFPDSNLAEALQRITGVQINRLRGVGEEVNIRGLEQNRVEVNGRTRTGNPFTDIPAELLSAVEVFKTPTADRIEGSLGGTINLRTRRPLEVNSRLFNMSAESSYADNREQWSPAASATFTDQWNLGAGDFGISGGLNYREFNLRGDRLTFPSFVTSANYDSNGDGVIYAGPQVNPANGAIVAYRAINPDGTLGTTYTAATAPAADNVAVVQPTRFLGGYELEDRDSLAANIALQWRPAGFDGDFFLEGSYTDFVIAYRRTFVQLVPTGNTDPTFGGGGYNAATRRAQILINPVIEDGVAVAATIPGRTINMLAATNVRDGQNLSLATGVNWHKGDVLDVAAEVSYAKDDSYTDALLLSLVHPTFVDLQYDWRTEIPTVRVVQSNLLTNNANSLTLGTWADSSTLLDESELAAKIDFDWHTNWGMLKTIQFGVRSTNTDRVQTGQSLASMGGLNFQAITPRIPVSVLGDLFRDPLPLTDLFPGQDADVIRVFSGFDPDILADDPARVRAAVTALNPAAALVDNPLSTSVFDEKTAAAYVRFDFENERFIPFRGNIGVRAIELERFSEGSILTGGVYTPVEYNISESDVLPSLNVAFEASEDFVVRVGAGRVLSRPDFQQLRPGLTVNTAQNTGSGGNPLLEPFTAVQYDVSLEWYFGRGDLLAATWFYKDVESFIVNSSGPEEIFDSTEDLNGDGVPDGGSVIFQITRPRNGSQGVIRGYELAYVQAWDFLPAPFDGMGASLNYTFTLSNNPNELLGTGQAAPIEDLSKHSANATVYYEDDVFSARASYNYRSRFLDITFAQALLGPQYRNERGQLDLAFQYKFNQQYSLNLDVIDVLKTATVDSPENELIPARYESDDRRFVVSLRGRF